MTAPAASPPSSTLGINDPEWTVRDVVTRYPAAIAVFKAFRVEACCDASRRPGDAAERAGIMRDTLIRGLETVLAGRD